MGLNGQTNEHCLCSVCFSDCVYCNSSSTTLFVLSGFCFDADAGYRDSNLCCTCLHNEVSTKATFACCVE